LTLWVWRGVQTHPNVDKQLFLEHSTIGLKQANKPFPINTSLGVVKWRMQTTDESFIPVQSALQMQCGPDE
jgi:coatomer subunit delta